VLLPLCSAVMGLIWDAGRLFLRKPLRTTAIVPIVVSKYTLSPSSLAPASVTAPPTFEFEFFWWKLRPLLLQLEAFA